MCCGKTAFAVTATALNIVDKQINYHNSLIDQAEIEDAYKNSVLILGCILDLQQGLVGIKEGMDSVQQDVVSVQQVMNTVQQGINSVQQGVNVVQQSADVVQQSVAECSKV